jgi:hypothetical protein
VLNRIHVFFSFLFILVSVSMVVIRFVDAGLCLLLMSYFPPINEVILFIKHGLHFRRIGCYITRVVLDLVFYHLTRHGLFVFAHHDVNVWFAQPFSPLEGGTSLIEGGSAGHMMHIL